MRPTRGWGGCNSVCGEIIEADGAPGVSRQLARFPSLITRGQGRAYGDAALNARAMLSLARADHVIAFDPVAGEIEIEAGAKLSDLLEFLLRHGWFPPVSPGTAGVSIGGMVAADVHGKNHLSAGTFGRHVTALSLVLADGERVRLSPEDPLFWATMGGMGLTGVITAVRFHLLRVPGADLRIITRKAGCLDATLELCHEAAASTYSVAWIDAARGRGLIFSGEHAAGASEAQAQPHEIPFDLPLARWNPVVAAFNLGYFHAHRPGARTVSFRRFFYPLDRLAHWNRLYGRRGLLQYQCVLPHAPGEAGLRHLLHEVARHEVAPALAVLKLCGAEGRGLLSFPRPGFSLALDFPADAAALSLLDRLDAIVIEHGGRLYLAKDARAKPESLRHYPGLDAFRVLRERYDPGRKFTSLLSQRLGL